MQFKEVVKNLNKMAPLKLGESWDNVGLLVEPPSKTQVHVIMLTNDLTEDVLEEAICKKADLILSYHPPIFRALKSITTKHWKERIVAICLEKGIGIYSPHTCYDALQGGVNDWLIGAFGAGKVTPLEYSMKGGELTHQVEIRHQDISGGDDDLLTQLKSALKTTTSEIWQTENSIHVWCSQSTLPLIIAFMNGKNNPLVISKFEQSPIVGTGMGRKVKLDNTITLKEAIKRVKDHVSLPHVRLAVAAGATQESQISTVAVCAGAGATILRGVKVDLLLTGEMSHHEVLEAAQTGSSVILTDHSNSERGFLKVLKPSITSSLQNKVQVIISERDVDPLQVV